MASWPIRKCSEERERRNNERAEGKARRERRKGMASGLKERLGERGDG